MEVGVLEKARLLSLCNKLLWQWYNDHNSIWAQIWREKYVPLTPYQDLTRIQNFPTGSHIWNVAKKGREIINPNNFLRYEILIQLSFTTIPETNCIHYNIM